MKLRKFLKSFLAVAVMLLALGVLAACGTPTASSTTEATPTNSDIAKIYNQYSAYAEENGVTPLPYEIWLATIKGEQGDAGLSAYEIWLEMGNNGDLNAFFAWLKGADGLSAYEIWLEAGNNGSEEDFLNWLKGTTGEKGEDGLSVYEIWLKAGHEGSEEDFLNWLKGQVSYHSHTFVEWEEDRYSDNCEDRIYITFCSECGEIRFKKGVYSDHVWEEEYSYKDAEHHGIKCENCEAVKDLLPHEGGQVSCTKQAICSICNTAYGSLKDHTFDAIHYDKQYHWYTCYCGAKSNAENHTLLPYNDKSVCSVCSYETSYTYNTYTSFDPSNWNELTYASNVDYQIIQYINGSFFTYDYKFDKNGNIIPGDYTVQYSAATKLEDVTALYAEEWGLPATGSGYAWKITLRDDLKWENGDPIKAADFVYSMKEQLNPLFQNYRADSFYAGETIIHNAQAYVMQGQTFTSYDNYAAGLLYSVADLVKGDDGVYTQPDGKGIHFAMTATLAYLLGTSVAYYKQYMDQEAYAALEALADENGNVAITDETIALWTKLIDTAEWGYEGPECLPAYMVMDSYTYPAVDFDTEVGMFADGEYGIVLILDQALPLLKEDGSLAYYAAYNMSSLPLVHQATYEANKVAPAEEDGLWTSTYNSSKETTMSWGPYKLESFQHGRQYTLVRNENWYGYNMAENEGLYQTDRIVCDTIAEYDSAFAKFLSGEIDGISIDVSVADDYKNSYRAYFTPDDYVASLQLQSDAEALKAREEAGIDKEILADVNFRKALSLAINRADFAKQTTTSSLAGFGLFNSMHYYDVENGKVYRESDYAKMVLCNIYGVDPSEFASLDDAVDSITGYDLSAARALVIEAYNAALAAGTISATDKVVLTMGSGAINETVRKRFDYIAQEWTDLVVGTPLEGRLKFEIKDFAGAADDFRAGKYDVCMGGWIGVAWDPGYLLLAYLSPSYMYSAAWNTFSTKMTFTMKGVGKNGEDITETMSLMDWYNCLNGNIGKYDWSADALPQELRVQLIAALEEQILKVYYTIPLYNNASASLLSYKVDYISYEYNTFMGFGGIKYMRYNYTDAEWAQAVAEAGGELNYK